MRSETASTPALPGRPRSEHAKRAVLDAVQELVEKGGYRAATIDAIAARSGVAKTTIYRWWPNRAALVVDLLAEIAAEQVPPPSGPEPLQAIRQELDLIAEGSTALLGRLLTSLVVAADHDPEVRSALIERL